MNQMKKFFKVCTLCLFSLLLSAPVLAAERGSPDEAVALVKKAIAYLKEHGKEKAFAEFTRPSGDFADRDLYILAFSTNGDGIALAHGGNARLVGKSLLELRDVDGKYIVKEFVKTANDKTGKGWVDYKWPHPVSKAIEAKSTYIERIGDTAIACGIYK